MLNMKPLKQTQNSGSERLNLFGLDLNHSCDVNYLSLVRGDMVIYSGKVVKYRWVQFDKRFLYCSFYF